MCEQFSQLLESTRISAKDCDFGVRLRFFCSYRGARLPFGPKSRYKRKEGRVNNKPISYVVLKTLSKNEDNYFQLSIIVDQSSLLSEP
mmetsp:Transcript_22889/g.48699  ORF Transcript_22889/g.48699 Transcript_22889/m.48699 type:complete len:88 (+) Transcript_22889:1307-1570(+)